MPGRGGGGGRRPGSHRTSHIPLHGRVPGHVHCRPPARPPAARALPLGTVGGAHLPFGGRTVRPAAPFPPPPWPWGRRSLPCSQARGCSDSHSVQTLSQCVQNTQHMSHYKCRIAVLIRCFCPGDVGMWGSRQRCVTPPALRPRLPRYVRPAHTCHGTDTRRARVAPAPHSRPPPPVSQGNPLEHFSFIWSCVPFLMQRWRPGAGFHFLNRRPVQLSCQDNGRTGEMYEALFNRSCPWTRPDLKTGMTYCCACFVVTGARLGAVARATWQTALRYVDGTTPPASTEFQRGRTYARSRAATLKLFEELQRRGFQDPPGTRLPKSVYPIPVPFLARLKLEADSVARLWHVLLEGTDTLTELKRYHPKQCGGLATWE